MLLAGAQLLLRIPLLRLQFAVLLQQLHHLSMLPLLRLVLPDALPLSPTVGASSIDCNI